MNHSIIYCIAIVSLAGCGPVDSTEADQCMRREIFFQCLSSIPKGPEKTVTNDWDEVVSECGSQAYYQAMRRRSQITQECRP